MEAHYRGIMQKSGRRDAAGETGTRPMISARLLINRIWLMDLLNLA